MRRRRGRVLGPGRVSRLERPGGGAYGELAPGPSVVAGGADAGGADAPLGRATGRSAGAGAGAGDGGDEGTGDGATGGSAATGGSGATGAGVASVVVVVVAVVAAAAAASAVLSDSTADRSCSAIVSTPASFLSRRSCIASSLDPTPASAVMISPANLFRLLPARTDAGRGGVSPILRLATIGSDAALSPARAKRR